MSFLAAAAIVGGVIAIGAGATQYGIARSGRKERIREQNAAKEEMKANKAKYEKLDTSNIAANVRNQFTGMENTMEDLTVNQQQAQFEAQQGMQQRANIMQQLKGAAGGSGIAGLAQAMANQGALASQRAGASIGAQESRLQMAKAQEASRLQTMERQGEVAAQTQRLAGAETARGLDWKKTGTLLGMSQERVAAANQARAESKAQQMQAFGTIASGGSSIASSAIGKMG